MLLLEISAEDQAEAIEDLTNGKTYSEIKAKFKKKQKDEDQEIFITMTEADVKRGLIKRLEELGEEVVSGGEFRTWADRAPDLISRRDGVDTVWECKCNPSREGMYQALGQTEIYAYTVGRNCQRGIAYSDHEEKHIATHALFLMLNHMRMERINRVQVPKYETSTEAGLPATEYH